MKRSPRQNNENSSSSYVLLLPITYQYISSLFFCHMQLKIWEHIRLTLLILCKIKGFRSYHFEQIEVFWHTLSTCLLHLWGFTQHSPWSTEPPLQSNNRALKCAKHHPSSPSFTLTPISLSHTHSLNLFSSIHIPKKRGKGTCTLFCTTGRHKGLLPWHSWLSHSGGNLWREKCFRLMKMTTAAF